MVPYLVATGVVKASKLFGYRLAAATDRHTLRMTTAARLNARLDAAVAKKLEYLKKRTRQSTTDVVRRSIELYYDSVAKNDEALELLEQSGFIGCAEGPRDLSKRYKAELMRILAEKA